MSSLQVISFQKIFFVLILTYDTIDLSRKYDIRRPYIAPGGSIINNEKELGETLLL